MILHHNVDKALLCGGRAEATYGGGRVLEPFELLLSGRATRVFKGMAIPVEDLAVEASRDWFGEHLHALDPVEHVRVRSLVRPGSVELQELFAHAGAEALANDTSCGVGFAPLTPLERVVLGWSGRSTRRRSNKHSPRSARTSRSWESGGTTRSA